MTRPALVPFCRLVAQKLDRRETEVPFFINTAQEFIAMMEAYNEMMSAGMVERKGGE